MCPLQVAGTCVTSGGDNNHQGMFQFPAGSGVWYLAYHTRYLARTRNECVPCCCVHHGVRR